MKKASVRMLSLLLVLSMIFGLMPVQAFASSETELSAALSEAGSFVDALTVDNPSNDPSDVVSNFGTHFTWDNEKREGSKSYLYDWSYYNGVVFEGIEYLYEVTEKDAYADYVIEYLSSLITEDGGWAACGNDASKTAAGYDATHGADCYKTASLLLDAYEMTGDSRYLTMAETLYADLDTAAESYSLADAGSNYRHTWATDPTPDLWLDGLYMILPFRAEYAAYTGDTEELELIVDRMQWVSDNMYDESKGLFYHAADSASSNSGTYWLRSIGWYAAAIVDIMDSMEGENLEAMQAQLVKLVDGMKAVQNASNGMWLNDMAAEQSAANPYETSGTALVCYAVMKAVNEGWLEESYADMAILAFQGICNEKLDNNTLTDICFKGVPGGSNSTFYDNEGKGVGPFIMLYAEVLEYAENVAEEEKTLRALTVDGTTAYAVGDELTFSDITAVYSDGSTEQVALSDCTVSGDYDMNTAGTYVVYVTYEDVTSTGYWFDVTEASSFVDETSGVSVSGAATLGGITVRDTTEDNKAAAEAVGAEYHVSYDITPNVTLAPGNKATVTLPVDSAWENVKCYYIPDSGEPEEVSGAHEDGTFTFVTDHFSTWMLTGSTRAAELGVSGTGNLVGGTVYTLDTNGVTANKNYLIVNTRNDGTAYALTNNNGTVTRTVVTISDGTITVADDTNIAWTFSGNASGTVGNNGRYVYPNNNSLSLNTSGSNLTINNQGNGAYRISRSSGSRTYYVRYNSNSWTGSTSNSNVYLFEYTSSSAGEEVIFTVTPSSAALKPKDTAELTGTVTLAGVPVDLSNCTITWASSNEAYATVSGGIVTGVADGNTNITATLSAVNGTALQEDIVLTIPVTVQSKAVVSGTLSGNDPVTTKQNVDPDFSNIKLTVTYDDGSTGVITVSNGLVIEGYDITTIGYSYADISYAGVKYGTVRVTVEGNPYEGLEDATEYPEYPADGAVRIRKTATEVAFEDTGVVNVELDVAGISVKTGVDAVLTIDISNSMAWATGTTSSDGYASYNKLDEVMEAVKTFASILLDSNEDGTATNNTITIVTFAGYDAEHWNGSGSYIDSVRTLVSGTSSYEVVKAIADGTYFTSADGITISYIPDDEDQNDVDNVTSEAGSNRGDTNYDYGFWQTSQAITNGKLGGENREIHVLFMTDGCASNFNNYYYRSSNVSYYYRPGTRTAYTYYAASNGTAWTNYIQNTLIPNNNGNIYANEVYEKVNGMYAVGFDMAHGSFSGLSTWDNSVDWEAVFNQIISKVVTDEEGNGLIDVTPASDSETLKSFYESMGKALRYAGTSANASDVIDSDFTLQMTQTTGTDAATNKGDLGFEPTITVKAYALWTKEETSDSKKIGTRKTNEDGSYVVETLETVSFKNNGTEAYSTLKENGTKNIMTTAADGTVTIEAHYFTYTKTPEGVETFKWSIGNITDKEIALSYYAYLTGSLEGERPKGLYYTNEEAKVEYIDINGDHATKTFPVPAVAWGGASTAYEFYLVNENGEPCDRNGVVVPFANRVIITGPFYEELYLNQEDDNIAQEIIAAYVLPAGYTLYDDTAKYTVVTASGGREGSLTISAPADGKVQTTMLVSATTPSYIQSHVAFGVIYNLIPEESEFALNPNQVVIDYGKPIVVDIADGDENNVEAGYTAELVGFSKYYDNVDLKTQFSSTPAIDNFKETYGTFSIEGEGSKRQVRYTPTRIVDDVEMIFCVIKMSNASTNDVYYMVDWLTVIPATTVYYETDFAEGVFTYNGFEETKSDATNANSPQDDGTVGNGQTYGFDSTYENDSMYSNHTSEYAEGAGLDATKTTFTFTGTGFEIISRTGDQQGLIQAKIYNTSDTLVKTVSVLNKSESELELYQIPVISVNDLTYGTYKVVIGVMQGYSSDEYPALNRGNQFYFDAVRVFDPALNNAVATAAYAKDGEAAPIVTEIRAKVLAAGAFDSADLVNSPLTDAAVFVDRTPNGVDIANYSAIGPNNELYLEQNQGVAFKLENLGTPASIDVGVKAIEAGAQPIANAAIYTADEAQVSTFVKSITSNTAQNYPLYNVGQGTAIVDSAYVVIYNSGEDVLSVTDIKVAYADAGSGVAEVAFLVDQEVLSVASTFMLRSTAPEIPEETEPEETEPDATEPEGTEPEEPEYVPNYDIISVSFNSDSAKILRVTTMTVVTTQDVESLRVKNVFGLSALASSSYVDEEDGSRTWTVAMIPVMIGNLKYTVTGYGADGTAGAAASDSIYVSLF